VDAAAKRMRTTNTFAAWKEGSTLWGRLVKAILNCETHIICCARSKTSYEQTTENGKKVVRKVGMAPELRDGVEYEFDLVGEMDWEHNLVITKSRCHAVSGACVKCPDEGFMKPVLEWLNTGQAPAATSAASSEPAQERPTPRPAPEPVDQSLYDAAKDALAGLWEKGQKKAVANLLAEHGARVLDQLANNAPALMAIVDAATVTERPEDDQ